MPSLVVPSNACLRELMTSSVTIEPMLSALRLVEIPPRARPLPEIVLLYTPYVRSATRIRCFEKRQTIPRLNDSTSVPGQSRHFDPAPATSGLRRTTDMIRASRHVSQVPVGDIAWPDMKEAAN
jgi:hypothetical protein